MKKVLITILACSALMTSCKKERTCTCTTSTESSFFSDAIGATGDSSVEDNFGASIFDSFLGGSSEVKYIIKDTKKNAEAECESYESTSGFNMLSATTTCELED